MINSLSYNDQQLWYMINKLSWQWSMFIIHDQQSFIQWSMLIMHELLWMILFIKPWTMQTVSIHSLSLFCSVARRPPASEEGGMVALSQMALLIMYEICWSSNDRLLIMDEICWSCNDAAVDRGWNLFIMLWYAIDHGDDMLIVPMIRVLIMHDVLQNYVTMKVIVITTHPWQAPSWTPPAPWSPIVNHPLHHHIHDQLRINISFSSEF